MEDKNRFKIIFFQKHISLNKKVLNYFHLTKHCEKHFNNIEIISCKEVTPHSLQFYSEGKYISFGLTV